ncbi:ABC transporter substrate-binding protein [Rhodopila sp.]|jgi:branched-chain amino acid transport system substrate-binding protein|uniref:ABC transporter substrate-binding protein n=1 Tax=Rhodopila sp. TaxID=2480087 RepID=UPI002BEE2FB6|nr:ABC transporter substrate-binding protein [Rhodopila sp.]HVZ08325.1 ABC transporter substrate-binding protein [Rhodopila sp.]
MAITRRAVLTTAAATLAATPLRHPRAQASDTIKIGVLTDLSGNYRDVTGPTSVACAQLAVDEFTKANPGIKVQLISGDHLNKPDVAASIVRQWFDQDGVDMVTDVGNSAAAIAVTTVAAEKDKAHVNTSAGSSVLTGKYCNANQIHWTYDTWNLSHTMTQAIVAKGGKKWFFITADYTFGHSVEDDTTKLLAAAGGTKAGSAAYPFPGTTDFSSYLLQAQASGANVLALANAGDDVINCIKQAREFGLTGKGLIIAAMVSSVTAVMGAGLDTMQDVYQSETFYWDLNDRSRAFMSRIKPRLPANVFPNAVHAGNYSATWAYLETVKQIGVAKAKASGRATIAAMKENTFDDDVFGKTTIRPDGRALHDSYLFRVKKPSESKHPGDVYDVLATVPADQAFRPLSEGGCPLVKS